MLRKKFHIPIGILIVAICAIGFLSLRCDVPEKPIQIYKATLTETPATDETAETETAETGPSTRTALGMLNRIRRETVEQPMSNFSQRKSSSSPPLREIRKYSRKNVRNINNFSEDMSNSKNKLKSVKKSNQKKQRFPKMSRSRLSALERIQKCHPIILVFLFGCRIENISHICQILHKERLNS